MKIVYVSFHSHCEIPLEPILEVLSERGHEIIKYDPDEQNQNISKDTDVVLITSNALHRRPSYHPPNPYSKIQLDGRIRTYFIPHGLGAEEWANIMNQDTGVLLAGKKPWRPPRQGKNWKIVGWAKTDVLFNPRKDRVEYVNNLMANLPYDKSVLYIPAGDGKGLYTSLLFPYFDEHKINVITPYREYHNTARKCFRKYNHIAIPEIKNLYYFAPHIRVVVCIGYTSVSREFYITKIPSIHLHHGFHETLNFSNVNKKSFDHLFSTIWNNPNSFIQPDNVIKDFIEINDGKCVERIVKEIEQ